jgi:hypothetical protein
MNRTEEKVKPGVPCALIKVSRHVVVHAMVPLPIVYNPSPILVDTTGLHPKYETEIDSEPHLLSNDTLSK